MSSIVLPGAAAPPSPEQLCKLQAVEIGELRAQLASYEAMLPTLANIAVVLVQRNGDDDGIVVITDDDVRAADGIRLNVDPAPTGSLVLSLAEAPGSLESS